MVTGATSGIGRAAALGLAKLGARVVIVARDERRSRDARDAIRSASGNDKIEILLADFASQTSVRALAAEYLRTHDSLHVLVNNAGVNVGRRTMTSDGIEVNFGVNHLACFLLTNLLLDVLRSSAPSRIVNVASGAEAMGRIRFDDLMGERKYGAMRAYNQSKLANVLFTYELARRLGSSRVTVNCLHPGFVRTNIAHDMTGIGRFAAWIGRPFARTPEQGADTVLYLACSPEVEGITGRYFMDRRERRSSRRSYDTEAAERLWRVSEQLTNLGLQDQPVRVQQSRGGDRSFNA